jgi:bacteriocin-like protein
MTPIESISDHELAQVSGGKSDKFAQYAGLATNLLGMFTGGGGGSSSGGLMSLFKGLGGLGKTRSKGSGQNTSQDTSQSKSTGSSDSDSSSDSSAGSSSEAGDDGG